jgi:hypothetical protein
VKIKFLVMKLFFFTENHFLLNFFILLIYHIYSLKIMKRRLSAILQKYESRGPKIVYTKDKSTTTFSYSLRIDDFTVHRLIPELYKI